MRGRKFVMGTEKSPNEFIKNKKHIFKDLNGRIPQIIGSVTEREYADIHSALISGKIPRSNLTPKEREIADKIRVCTSNPTSLCIVTIRNSPPIFKENVFTWKNKRNSAERYSAVCGNVYLGEFADVDLARKKVNEFISNYSDKINSELRLPNPDPVKPKIASSGIFRCKISRSKDIESVKVRYKKEDRNAIGVFYK